VISIETKRVARAELMTSARHAARHGLRMHDWATNADIMAYARRYDVFNELEHMVRVAYAFR
jgi:hypothetical protein